MYTVIATKPCDIFRVKLSDWNAAVPNHVTKALVDQFKSRFTNDVTRAKTVITKSKQARAKMCAGDNNSRIEVRTFQESPFLKRKVLPADTPVAALSDLHLNTPLKEIRKDTTTTSSSTKPSIFSNNGKNVMLNTFLRDHTNVGSQPFMNIHFQQAKSSDHKDDTPVFQSIYKKVDSSAKLPIKSGGIGNSGLLPELQCLIGVGEKKFNEMTARRWC